MAEVRVTAWSWVDQGAVGHAEPKHLQIMFERRVTARRNWLLPREVDLLAVDQWAMLGEVLEVG